MNTILVGYGHPVLTKQYVTRQAKRDLQGVNDRKQFFRINWSINY